MDRPETREDGYRDPGFWNFRSRVGIAVGLTFDFGDHQSEESCHTQHDPNCTLVFELLVTKTRNHLARKQ
jgi:hypothetical protein